MEQSRLDVFSIQNIAEEILYAINGISEASNITLFTGLTSHFILGGIEIPKRFPTVLCVKDNIGSEKYGRLIKFMEGASFTEDTIVSDGLSFKKSDLLTEDTIKKILLERQIDFKEIKSFPKTSDNASEKNLPEIWFGRDVNILRESLAGNMTKKASYYPNILGKIELIYYDGNGDSIVIDKREVNGLIELENRVLLIVRPTPIDMKDYKRDSSMRIRGGGGEQYLGSLGYYLLNPEVSAIAVKLKTLGINTEVKEGLPEFLKRLRDTNVDLEDKNKIEKKQENVHSK